MDFTCTPYEVRVSQEKKDGVFHETNKGDSRLIIGYTDNRAKKDKYNREKGVKRLKNICKSGTITKENLNKCGYNKFLEITTLKIKLLASGETLTKTMLLTKKHKSIQQLFDKKFWNFLSG